MEMGVLGKAGLSAMILASAMSACAQAVSPTIRSVVVLGAGESMEVEVIASAPVTAQTQVATSPDRLIIDFPNTQPDAKLRNSTINRGELKSVRIGLFSTNPPVTRVVLDLKSPQAYQLYPSGKTMIVKLRGGGVSSTQASVQPAAVASAPPVPVEPPKPAPKVDVDFKNGKLKIWANRASLAEVLNEVRRRTGADITFPPGSGQEPIVANLGPAPAREVLAALLNGSQFNFVILGSDQDPAQLRSVFLTMRGGSSTSNSMSYPAVSSAETYATPPVRGGGSNPQPEFQPEPVADQDPPIQEAPPNQVPPQDGTPQQ